MTIRPWTSADLGTLNRWWREWHPQHAEALSFEARMLPSGWVVEDQHEGQPRPLAMGFLYRTDSCIAWLEWVTAEPNVRRDVRGPAIDHLLSHIVAEARGQGFLSLFTATNVSALGARLEQAGFATTDRAMVHMVRRL